MDEINKTTKQNHINQRIGRNLRLLRKAAGFSQKQLADLLAVTYQQVQKYETGDNRLSADKLYVLRHHLNVSYDSFFTEIDQNREIKTTGLLYKISSLNDKILQGKAEAILDILIS